jgi:hypothetical protein
MVKSPRRKKDGPRVKVCIPWWQIALGILIFGSAIFSYVLVGLQDPQHLKDSPLHLARAEFVVLKESPRFHVRAGDIISERKERTPAGEVVVVSGSFQREPPTLPLSYKQSLDKLEESTGKKSCRRNPQGEYTFNGDYCTQENAEYTYHNSLPVERLLCGGVKIDNLSSIQLKRKCAEPAKLFPVTPDRTGLSMPEVKTGFSNGHFTRFPCDIPCLSSGQPGTVANRFVKSIYGEDWNLQHSMEGPQYYHNLIIKPEAYKENRFYSTTSYDSEVPLPYFSWSDFNIETTTAVDFDKAIKGASFLARNCNSKNNREKVVKELQESSFRTDSVSSCLHNAEPPPGVSKKNKGDVMRSYLFYLAFENQCEKDYITEKLWGPLQSGTVPVYYGSPNVKEHVPNNSIIHVDDFSSTDELAAYLGKVANNRTLYEKYQEWRSKPLPPHFHARYDFTKIHSTCRTCRWAYARFYGLGWNHNNQSLRELVTPREPCLGDASGLLQRPVVEQYYVSDKSRTLLKTDESAGAACPLKNEFATVALDGGSLRRTVWYKDGTIDLWIEPMSSLKSPVMLRLETPFPENEQIQVEEKEEGHVRLQGSRTRYTVLLWPKLKVDLKTTAAAGIVEVPLFPGMPLRLRILVEDVETLRKGADQEENFFGKLMIQDFFNPVEAFL